MIRVDSVEGAPLGEPARARVGAEGGRAPAYRRAACARRTSSHGTDDQQCSR